MIYVFHMDKSDYVIDISFVNREPAESRINLPLYFMEGQIDINHVDFRAGGHHQLDFLIGKIEYIINDSGASVFFYDGEFHDRIAAIQAKLKGVTCFVATGVSTPGLAIDYDVLVAEGDTEEVHVAVEEGDPCQLMYTSGTTGRPKGAVHTHASLLQRHGQHITSVAIRILIRLFRVFFL